MKLPDTRIQALQPDTVTLALFLTADHEAFAGHFPGHPILPGVVQTDWAVRLAMQYLALTNDAVSDVRIKFRDTITPERPLTLILNYQRTSQRLDFSYQSDEDQMSVGQIRFGG